jgi:hypothetical protein
VIKRRRIRRATQSKPKRGDEGTKKREEEEVGKKKREEGKWGRMTDPEIHTDRQIRTVGTSR